MLTNVKAADFERRALELNPQLRRSAPRVPRPPQWCKGHSALLPANRFHGSAHVYCDECRAERRRVRQDPVLHAAAKAAKRRARHPLSARTLERRGDPQGFRERERVRRRQRDYERRIPGGAVPTRPMPDQCECCGKPRAAYGKKFARDHEHGTEVFRGWLCGQCNAGIGLLGDSLLGLQQAIRYLERARAAAPEDLQWLIG